eukprot:TRINITY_DN4399_c0_g1_i4.p2 TRINITY_DN4399_c0_g1~~TRINITY_DN4399_c0_g1_i4.p2  ORF type:complete len:105 (-),score=18.50 TRINITY_DN4399_c0_g1_i4:109-423(-)
MQTGDALTFELAMGTKGYHAVNIQKAIGAGEQVTGKLKKIHNGMGFCSVEGVVGDVLLGKRSLSESGIDGSSIRVGDVFMFELLKNARGYEAVNIQDGRSVEAL